MECRVSAIDRRCPQSPTAQHILFRCRPFHARRLQPFPPPRGLLTHVPATPGGYLTVDDHARGRNRPFCHCQVFSPSPCRSPSLSIALPMASPPTWPTLHGRLPSSRDVDGRCTCTRGPLRPDRRRTLARWPAFWSSSLHLACTSPAPRLHAIASLVRRLRCMILDEYTRIETSPAPSVDRPRRPLSPSVALRHPLSPPPTIPCPSLNDVRLTSAARLAPDKHQSTPDGHRGLNHCALSCLVDSCVALI